MSKWNWKWNKRGKRSSPPEPPNGGPPAEGNMLPQVPEWVLPPSPPIIRQEAHEECGLACLTTSAH